MVVIALARGLRWCRVGGSRRGWGRVTTEGAGVPIPVPRTLRRREGTRWVVRSTATLSGMPRPVVRAVSVGRWAGGVGRSSVGETDVFSAPPKTSVSTHPSASTQKTHMKWPLPQSFPWESFPWARTKGTANTKRTMRAMSDITKDRYPKRWIGLVRRGRSLRQKSRYW
jgi:hypothetical protein